MEKKGEMRVNTVVQRVARSAISSLEFLREERKHIRGHPANFFANEERATLTLCSELDSDLINPGYHSKCVQMHQFCTSC